MSHLQNPQGLVINHRLTLAEQYLAEAFPQPWTRSRQLEEASKFFTVEEEPKEEEESAEDFHGPIYVFVGNRRIQI